MTPETEPKWRVALKSMLRSPRISRARALEIARDECRRLSLPGADNAMVYGGFFSRYFTVVVAASEADGGISIVIDKQDGHVVGVSGHDDVTP